ncbi:hypothetical protein, partial [Trichormus sp. NMC-1]|uniref:hypothetical protein n=1 Tax=Trichormus sp. NMC-1 TaxID=1853259 RepID=UPI00115FFDB9
MKTATLIIFTLIFLTCCGQTNEKRAIRQTQDVTAPPDISKLWNEQLHKLSFLRQVNLDEAKKMTIDLSSILAYDKNENEYLSRFIGAFGQNYQRIDLLVVSAKHIGQQTYSLELLCKFGETIDTLAGEILLKKAFEITDNIHTTFVFSYDYKFCSEDNNVCLKGTNSTSFYIEDNIPNNYWYEDGSFNDLVRTFVGTLTKKAIDNPVNCVFAVSPAGLYNYLPFCEGLYTVDDNENPEYYYISDKYKQFGWQDYDYRNPKKE